MKNEKRLEEIEEKISEIHRDYFLSGKKKREKHNFLIGLLVGIGISLMIGAGKDLWVNYDSFKLYHAILQTNNLTIQNLSLSEQIGYANLAFTNVHLIFLFLIGFFITYISFMYYAVVNKRLFSNKIVYSYKLNKGENLKDLTDRVACIFKTLKKEKQFKWLDGKIGYDALEERIVGTFYNKIKRLLLLEYDNRIIINKEKIIIFFQTSNFGETIGSLMSQFVDELKSNGIFKELKKEERI